MDNKRISLIGAGRLGLSFALLCDKNGYEVCAYEINKERRNQIANKTLKTSEPQIEELLSTSNLKLATNLRETLDFSDLIFIFVATPSNQDGSYNHEQVDRVIDEIELLNGIDKTIIINCTVMPKYCQKLQNRLKGLGINVLYNPEFIAQGSIIKGLQEADMVLIGSDTYIPSKILSLYEDIQLEKPIFNLLSLTGAEITKIAINSFLTLKTAFANMVGRVAIESGEEENVSQILEAVGSDKRIGNKYLGYGFPASGICLPRDIRALKVSMNNLQLGSRLLNTLSLENEDHINYLKTFYLKKNPHKNVPFFFSYLTYKSGVDIFTESKQLELALELLKEEYFIQLPPDQIDIQFPEEFEKYRKNKKVLFGQSVGLEYKVN